jgi:hypothetical protein
MNSHNPRSGFAFHKTPARQKTDDRETDLADAALGGDALSIAESPHEWCDPYNSTGKHVVLKAKLQERKT